MSEPFIGEIKIFGGNYAPRGWAFCNGQLLPISQNTALFSILGNTFGGDGRSTLGLPNMQGRAPMHPGQGPGLSQRRLGERGGVDQVTLDETHMPSHSHHLQAGTGVGPLGRGNTNDPIGNYTSVPTSGNQYASSGTKTPMSADAVSHKGSANPSPHNNMQSFLTMNFIVALAGQFPSRS